MHKLVRTVLGERLPLKSNATVLLWATQQCYC